MTSKERAKANLQDLISDLRPWVASIQAEDPTTKDNYGHYMGLLTAAGEDPLNRTLMAVALVEAGAEPAGVYAALDIHKIDIGSYSLMRTILL